MGHNHRTDNILLAFLLNAGLALVELVGGLLTNSVAILSDALHDFGDALALLFSYVAERMSDRDPDEKFTFGYKRFAILSAFVNGLILFGGGLVVIYQAINRLLNPDPVIPEGMVILAVLGIVVNGLAAFRLSKDHGTNSKMVMLHLLEDLLGSIAILVVSIVLLFKPWYFLDAILSILISVIILKGAYRHGLEALFIMLQRFPSELKIEEIAIKITSLNEVIDVHAFQGWSLDDRSFFLQFHVVLPETIMLREVEEVRTKIKRILESYSVESSAIEFETRRSEDCLDFFASVHEGRSPGAN